MGAYPRRQQGGDGDFRIALFVIPYPSLFVGTGERGRFGPSVVFHDHHISVALRALEAHLLSYQFELLGDLWFLRPLPLVVLGFLLIP